MLGFVSAFHFLCTTLILKFSTFSVNKFARRPAERDHLWSAVLTAPPPLDVVLLLSDEGGRGISKKRSSSAVPLSFNQ